MSLLESWLRSANSQQTAVVDDSGKLTYEELLQHSGELAQAYSSRFGTGRYLLLPARKSTQFVISLVAATRSGNIPVPVDPTAPPKVLEAIWSRCGDAVLVDSLPDQDTMSHTGRSGLFADAKEALVLFTSGTSGTPKGVPVSWDNLAHSIGTVSEYLEYKRYPSAAIVLPLHYSYALLTQLYCMFYVGGRARLFGNFRNPIRFSKSVNTEELQTFCGVPSTYQSICTIHRMSPLCMPGIRVLCSAGAAMDLSLMNEIREVFPQAHFFNNYGMTEATPRISYLRDDDPRFLEPTCGKAIAGLEVRVVDGNSHAQLPDGQQGIVAIRGPNVFSGYLNDPAGTKAVFTKDGFLLSGDCGHLDNGYIYITGRADEIFNVGGEKVAPLEIERALRQHDGVIASAVGKMQDEMRGTVAIAYIVTDAELRRKELVQFLESRLTPAKIPFRFLRVRELPLTPNGKLRRASLSPDDLSFVIGEIK